jgi:predicted DNA-binding protein
VTDVDKLIILKQDHHVTITLNDDTMNKLLTLHQGTGRTVPYIIAECINFALPRIEIK